MEFILEFIFELIIEGSIEIIKIQKVPKIIRYLLTSIIVLFFSTIIFGLIYIGLKTVKENVLGWLFIILGLFFLIGSIIKGKKVYKEYKSNQ